MLMTAYQARERLRLRRLLAASAPLWVPSPASADQSAPADARGAAHVHWSPRGPA